MNLQLIYPMFAMVSLTLVVGLVTISARIRAVKSGKMDGRYFKTYSVGEPTELVLKTGRHFSNLFEVPILFYTASVVAMVLAIQGPWILLWAWLFVVARCAHAYIHIGRNKIYPRMISFFLGFIAVFAMWIVILCNVLEK